MEKETIKTQITNADPIEKSDRELKGKPPEKEDDLLNLIAEIIVEIIIKKYRYGSDRIRKNK